MLVFLHDSDATGSDKIVPGTGDLLYSNVGKALADDKLQFAMTETGPRFIYKRTKAREALPEFDQLRGALLASTEKDTSA